ncbi:FAD-dependent monooxygenase [Nanchangia anserum]|uniref:FAD-dependent monooxygenase n=1 Tax=Nanchangia anserum TaxID=2692125 RepID=A0A8I0GBP3_9ACTO|nr:FAD-dependent monooxygenase [Nanchangia anserum]MBD3689215.1 FAD-dependent monooxygenase [Nanchangia anserum]QOX81439.1 FAD-dependent monooxygenase [Nanchangia anserum]
MQQFHHHGYVSTNPRVKPAAGVGLEERPADPPTELDVLIVGSGPAGMLMFSQLAEFGDVRTAMIERREGRLVLGHADGVQQRSVEMFQAFGFADEVIAEAYRITETSFWKPDPANPDHIYRAARTPDDPLGISEFPHLIINQARILDYLRERAGTYSPARLSPYYGWEFLDLEVVDGEEYPVHARLRRVGDGGEERLVRTKYLFGADGAHSRVRRAIGAQHLGKAQLHAWGVMDVLVNTDFPDIRNKAIIQSRHGSILHIPREGGYLARIYVDLGAQSAEDDHAVRQTPIDEIIRRANAILTPYSLDVREVAWWSVYEVGHRVTDRFDDVPTDEVGTRDPHVFIAGDACHTHSAKAGQGMNVSMQDAFNLGWKLGHVLTGRAPASLLATYTAERQQIAQDLIDFDSRWSSMMVKEEAEESIEDFYVRTAEFPAGFMTQYRPSILTWGDSDQEAARGIPLGKRFKSVEVGRRSDANPKQLGHLHEADGRWRLYVFADEAPAGAPDSALARWAMWMSENPVSPFRAYRRQGEDLDALIDAKVIYQQHHHDIDPNAVPELFKPVTGGLELVNLEKIFGITDDVDIFAEREIDRGGVVVAVRPDMYVAAIVPLSRPSEIADFFAGIYRRD